MNHDPNSQKMKSTGPIRTAFFALSLIVAALLHPTLLEGRPAGLDIPVEYPMREYSFEDPYFREMVRAGFARHPEHEPSLSRSEQRFFQEELLPLLEEEPATAIESVRETPQAEESPALYFVLGNLLLQRGDFRDAEAALKSSLRLHPGFLRARRALALALFQQERYAEARTHLLGILRRTSGDDQVYGLLAYTWLVEGKYGSALRAYENARMFRPESIDLRRGEAQCLMAMGRNREARALLDELIQDEPDDPAFWLMQTNTWLAEGDNLQAAANLAVVRDLGAASPTALMLYGNLLLEEGLPEVATGIYLEALEDAERPLPTKELIRPFRYLVERRSWDSAQRYLDSLIIRLPADLDPEKEGEIEVLRAQMELATNQDESAVERLLAVLGEDPLNAGALMTLASHFEAIGEYDEAEVHLRRAVRVEGIERDALVLLARVQVAQREYEKALDSLASAQQIEYRRAIERYMDSIRRVRDATR